MFRKIGFFTLVTLMSAGSLAETMDECLLLRLQQAADNSPVSEVHSFCRQQLGESVILDEQEIAASEISTPSGEDAVTYRLASEDHSEANPFMLTPHRPNYLLFATYNTKTNEEPWTSIYPNAEMNDAEVKFQISFKARIMEDLLGAELWGAYSQQSWWQLYNDDESAPFRETNYEPEIFLRWDTDFEILGFKNRTLRLGFTHESNGRSEVLSRSWNRIVAGATLERGNLVMIGRAWYRIPEAAENDDNPDIAEYMGYGDIKILYKLDQQTLGMTLTNNLRSDNKGSVQLDWTFPLTDRFKGYVQYYNGFGESLIDHDVSTERFGVGILLNDWL